MRWFDEIPSLFRRPIGEIGFAFYVREKMKNDMRCDAEELRLTIGQEWMDTIENMRRNGILHVEKTDNSYRLYVVAPGDKKRIRCKKIGRRNRAVKRFETALTTSNTKNTK